MAIIYAITESKRGQVVPTSAPFYAIPSDVANHLKTTYIDTGLITYTAHTSQNGLRRVRVFDAKDVATQLQLLNDPIFKADLQANTAYDNSNHIRMQEFDFDPTHELV